MTFEGIRKLVIIVLICASLLGVAAIQRHLNHLKDEHELVIRERVENLTPTMAFCTGALGGFRGLIADVLFLRLSLLQEKERYFELYELSHMILQLQPDTPQTVAHLAWNLAYNVSVKCTAPEDRWRWVRRGIELCRDYGLKYNPAAPVIRHQLGWIYQHKIGEMLDDANLYYKSQLALQMIEVLGQKRRYDWKALADAPDDEDGIKRALGRRHVGHLLLKDPAADDKAMTAALVGVAQEVKRLGRLPDFWAELFEANGVAEHMKAVFDETTEAGPAGAMAALDEHLVFIGEQSPFYQLMKENEMSHLNLEQAFRATGDGRPSGGLPEPFAAKADEWGISAILDDYFRSRWLRDVYKLDANEVPAILAKTGYLDFRLPYAHGIYWAQTGLAFAPKEKSLHRMVQQCLFSSAKWGHLQHISNDGFPIMRPNFESIDNYLAVYENQPTHTTGDRAGAENFLQDSIVMLFTWGEHSAGRKWFKELKKKRLNNYGKYKDKTYEEFALDYLAQDIAGKTQDQVSSILFGFAKRHLEALAYNEQDLADELLRLLQRIRVRYYEELKKGSRRAKRIRVPDVDELLREAKFFLCFNSGLPADVCERIWSVGPDLRPYLDRARREGDGNVMDPNTTRKPKIQR